GEEYSLRQAAVTIGWVLIVILPLVFLILLATRKLYHNYYKNPYPELGQKNLSLVRAKSRSKLSLNSLGTNSPSTKEKNFSPMSSPAFSDSTTSLSTKKRRSYDKVYRTHEPLPNRPDIEFEDKPFDLDMDAYEEGLRPNSVESSNTDGYLFDSDGYAQLQKRKPITTNSITSDV
ncbi:hypothetical protein HHI36_010486, partial [Cryptolaemus montrouzieri]